MGVTSIIEQLGQSRTKSIHPPHVRTVVFHPPCGRHVNSLNVLAGTPTPWNFVTYRVMARIQQRFHLLRTFPHANLVLAIQHLVREAVGRHESQPHRNSHPSAASPGAVIQYRLFQQTLVVHPATEACERREAGESNDEVSIRLYRHRIGTSVYTRYECCQGRVLSR